MNLEQIYRQTLARCDPAKLLRGRPSGPRNVLAIGKSAAAIDALPHDAALAALPAGYPEPRTSEVVKGGHPDMNADTFAAGRRVIEFVDAHEDILFLISGGGSACVDLPLAPHFEERDLIETNARLVASGIPIGEINCVR